MTRTFLVKSEEVTPSEVYKNKIEFIKSITDHYIKLKVKENTLKKRLH